VWPVQWGERCRGVVNSGRSAVIRAVNRPLRGRIALSGDKSVSIRRALFALFSHSEVCLSNYGTGEDCQSALLCLEALGKIVKRSDRDVIIHKGGSRTGVTLDCRNSGTTARLLMGILAGLDGEWTIIGDESLSKRPMTRVAEPLGKMGAEITLSEGGRLPAKIVGRKLSGCHQDLPVASAQVKSAILLAGLNAQGITSVREPMPSRDHTERLLGLRQSPDQIWSLDPSALGSHTLELNGAIPGDISSAAFWAVAALMLPDSDVEIEGVLLNPLRAAWFNTLRNAGASIDARVSGTQCGEQYGTLRIRYSELQPLHVRPEDVPGLIDEVVSLAVLAATISGTSRFENVGELRVKECDRLQAIHDNLSALGAHSEIVGDDLIIDGGEPMRGTALKTHSDHRIAMAFALAGLAADGETTLDDADCCAVSYPEFFDELATHFTHSVRFQ